MEQPADGTRRDGLTLKAIDPADGKYYDVTISYRRLHEFIKPRGLGAVLETRYTVLEVLQKPTGIFEGLCADADEPRQNDRNRGVGWRCYCGIPAHDYEEDGTEVPPRPNKVFLVFITDELVAYNWRWEECSSDDPRFPVNYQARFKEQLL